MLVTSIFSFSHNVFYPYHYKFQCLTHIYSVVCKCFQFGQVYKFVVWERVKAFADNKSSMLHMMGLASCRMENTRKRRKNSPKCFLKAFSTLLRSQGCWHTYSFKHNNKLLFENIVGKGEIARNEQFLLFPHCFLLKQIIESAFVHNFAIISLFAAALEESLKLAYQGKGLKVKGLKA